MRPEPARSSIRNILCFAMAGTILSSNAFGGMILTTQSTDGVTGKKHSQRTIVFGQMIRTEEPGKASIMRPDLGKLWELSSDGSTCLQYTAADLTRMRQATRDETRKESLPAPSPAPESPGTMAGGVVSRAPASPGAIYTKLSSGETVGKWRADRFARETDGVKTAEVWVVPLSAFKVPRSEFAGLEKTQAAFGAAPSAWDEEILSLLREAQSIGYEGFPVKIAVFDGSERARYVSQLSSVTRNKVPYRTFQPPEDCAKAAPPAGR